MVRRIQCGDGERWEVRAAGRPSPYRIDLVFSSADRPGVLYRAEVEGQEMGAFTDEELCWLLAEARKA